MIDVVPPNIVVTAAEPVVTGGNVDFDAPDLFGWLEVASAHDFDTLPFGLVAEFRFNGVTLHEDGGLAGGYTVFVIDATLTANPGCVTARVSSEASPQTAKLSA